LGEAGFDLFEGFVQILGCHRTRIEFQFGNNLDCLLGGGG
jgi:hypothetical protein